MDGWIPNGLDKRHLKPGNCEGCGKVMLLSIHVLLLITASLGMVTSMATVATTMATMSLALFDLVGAKSSPWDWQKGTGEYAKYVSSDV